MVGLEKDGREQAAKATGRGRTLPFLRPPARPKFSRPIVTMALNITLYSTSFEDQWDSFIRDSNNGTLFHTRRFLGYHPPTRHSDHSLLFTGDKGLLALFPAAMQLRGSKPWLVSHPGATFGGFVTPVGLTLQQSDDLAGALLDYGHKMDLGGITLTLSPTIYNRRLSNYIDAALLRHGFEYLRREVSSILYLERTPEANLKKFTDASSRAVRKALASDVTIRPSDDLDTYYDILLHNLERRHNVQPTHTLAELRQLATLFPDAIRLLAAFKDDRMIAGIVTFDANPDVILAYYICHDENYQQYRAVNLLFYRLIEEAIAARFRYLDFGIFTVDEEPNRGLARFKESFGASGMFRDKLTITL